MAGQRRTWDLSEFHGGLDLRDGLWSSNQTRFRQLDNLWVTKGRKLRRRPPALQVDGELSANCQGLVMVDGQLMTFAKDGDTVTHTGAVAGLVETKRFTNPDLATGWELLAAGVFDGYPVAWIKHTYPSTAYPALVLLHVWDGLLYAPTYVQDGYLPGAFSPSIEDLGEQEYDPAFRPVLGQGASKLWTSTTRGNVRCSRTADARVWNERTSASILEDGETWPFIVPEGAGVTRRFIVPRDASHLTGDGKWAYYVLERAVGSAWVPLEEVTAAPSVDWTWRPVSVPSRFAGGWNEIAVDVRWGSAAAGLIRLRLVAGGTAVEVLTAPSVAAGLNPGTGTTWRLSVGAGRFRYRGGDETTTAAYTTADLTPGKTYLLGVSSDGSWPTLINLTDDGFPNGWGREHRRLRQRIEVPTTATGVTAGHIPWTEWVPLAGTVQITAGSTAISGTGTSFTSPTILGAQVRIAAQERLVSTVTSNILADANSVWSASAGPGAAIDRAVPHYAIFDGADTQVAITGLTLTAGNGLRINGVDYEIKEVVSLGPTVVKVTKNGASGDYRSNLDGVYAVTRTNRPVITEYAYPFEGAENAWYADRVVEAADAAGAEDALSLSTAAQDNTGGRVSAIASIRQRMLITYPGSCQLWAIDQDTNRTAFLDSLSFGTGDQTAPPVVPWYSSLAMPSVTGWRAISVAGSNTDNLQDLNIGEPIQDLALGQVSAAQFWPWAGQLMVAIEDGATFLCLDYSRESKITAWSRWEIQGGAGVDAGTLVADGAKLWWRAGTRLRWLDHQATVFRDWIDPTATPYLSRARFHFNDMGSPGQSKRFVGVDVVQTGTATLSFLLPPYGAEFAAEPEGPALAGATIEGVTYGRARLPLMLTAQAVAPVVETRSTTAWELHALAIDFMTLRR